MSAARSIPASCALLGWFSRSLRYFWRPPHRARAGLGPDAEHGACGELHQPGQRATAEGDYLHPLDVLQPGQRRAADRDGREGIGAAAAITRHCDHSILTGEKSTYQLCAWTNPLT